SSISLFGQEAEQTFNLTNLLIMLEGTVAMMLFTGGLFMSLFATSSLIPAMLEPGNVNILISKPVSRFQLLAGRFLGAVAIVAFNVFYLVIFSWLILSLKTGIWNFGFLLSGVMIVVTFAILFTLMTLLGILTRSSAFSLMLTYLILFFSPLLLQRDNIYALLSKKIYSYIVDGLYYFLPKTAELGMMTQKLVRGVEVPGWMPLWSSLLFAAAMFILSGFLFARKDF
ncbi:MAG: ABC transporter permease subunit, partial [Calditrichia bacterium]